MQIKRHPGRLLLASSIVGAALLVAACSSGGSSAASSGSSSPTSEPASSQGLDLSGITLKVGIFHTVTEDQANLSGAFAGTSYKIDWVVFNGAAAAVEALQANAVNVVVDLSDTSAPLGDAEATQPWTAGSAPFKIVALLKPTNPGQYPGGIIAATKASGITSLADLRGKTYAFNEGGNTGALAMLALYKAGLKASDVKETLLSNDSLAPALISGAVDAASVDVSEVAAQLANGTVRQIATPAQVGFPDYLTVSAGQAPLANPQDSAAIGDFVERVAKFENWSTANVQAVAKTYVQTEQLTASQATLAANNSLYSVIPVGPTDPGTKSEIALAGLLYRAGFLPKPVNEAPLFDDRYSAQIAAGNS